MSKDFKSIRKFRREQELEGNGRKTVTQEHQTAKDKARNPKHQRRDWKRALACLCV